MYDYMVAHTRESKAMKMHRDAVVESHSRAVMSASPDESVFLRWLVSAMGFERVIEVGTFLGYTTLAIAEVLPEKGRIVALDVSEDFTGLARKGWEQAGVAHKVDLRIAPAVETMQKMLREEGEGSYDFVFIDADKSNYDAYYELGLKLIRVGGVVAVDNTLWWGKPAEPPAQHSADTKAIDALNKKLRDDKRVDISFLGIADGVTLCRKLPPAASL